MININKEKKCSKYDRCHISHSSCWSHRRREGDRCKLGVGHTRRRGCWGRSSRSGPGKILSKYKSSSENTIQTWAPCELPLASASFRWAEVMLEAAPVANQTSYLCTLYSYPASSPGGAVQPPAPPTPPLL